MYAIAGVTGHTGRVVAETLLAKGQPIRVVVRDENKNGAYVLLPPDPITTDFFGSRAKMIDAIGGAALAARSA